MTTTDKTTPTTATEAVDLLDTIRVRRVELAHVTRQRTLGNAGYSDVCAADYRLALAVQRARDAGLLVPAGRNAAADGILERLGQDEEVST